MASTASLTTLTAIETPEGPNIGLISYLATYARINEYGFIAVSYTHLDVYKRQEHTVAKSLEERICNLILKLLAHTFLIVFGSSASSTPSFSVSDILFK